MILLSHPTGNANVRAVSRALYSYGILREFHSCICWNPDTPIARYLPETLRLLLNRRSFSPIPKQLLYSHPWREIARLLLPSLPLGPLSVDAVLRGFDNRVSSRIRQVRGISGVYAYEDSALLSFESAKTLKLSCLYDLPIGYWRAARRIYTEERDLRPEWAVTLTGLLDSQAKLENKDRELQLADVVFVASSFVRSTLSESPSFQAPIEVIPYGAPPVYSALLPDLPHVPLRVLYVGSLGQRKGLSYLLEAIDQVDAPIRLTLIGQPTAPDCRPLRDALDANHWIASLPYQQILEQMRHHHVLVFPTLFDGFGLVIPEALSQGLPVISTPNSGAPECISDGLEGFIVPIRNSQAIAGCLQQLAEDPDLLFRMRTACLQRASELQWFHYERLLASTVMHYMS